jgi:hypothetical protein
VGIEEMMMVMRIPSKTRTRAAFVILIAMAAPFLTTSSYAEPTAPPPAAVPPASPPSATPAPAITWSKIRDEDGIVAYRGEVAGSSLLAMRGEATVDASIIKVANVLVDVQRAPEWMENMAEVRPLRRLGEGELVVYSHIKTPFILKDRDFVTKSKLELVPESKQIRISVRSIDDPLAPPTSYVRGHIMNSSFVLTSVEGDKTRITAEIHTDPKGAIPNWIVNHFQKNWAFNTLTRLRKQAAKSDIKDQPRLREAMVAKGWTP